MKARNLAILGGMLGLASSTSGLTNTDKMPSGSLEDKVSPNRIRGNYHTHTTMSDGIHTPEEVVEKAIKEDVEWGLYGSDEMPRMLSQPPF